MSMIFRLTQKQPVSRALAQIPHEKQAVLGTAVAIQQIAAPTFAEAERAGWVEQQFKQFGLHDVAQDRLHNVYGRLPGSATDQTEPVVVSAHTDTVFPAPTDLTVRYAENNRIYGPGIADNSTGVAGLLWLIQSLQKTQSKGCQRYLVCGQCGRRRARGFVRYATCR